MSVWFLKDKTNCFVGVFSLISLGCKTNEIAALVADKSAWDAPPRKQNPIYGVTNPASDVHKVIHTLKMKVNRAGTPNMPCDVHFNFAWGPISV